MRVFALVGKSGTGKSYQCNSLANDLNIESIIDDGLLISKNRILAGKSAKHELNKMASVKRAIFENPDHVREVKKAFAEYSIDSVLILGTSEQMVRRIAEKLDLPPVEHITYIDEIASPEDLETAAYMRNTQGKHIIPAPVPEVKKHFSGYFIKSLIIPGKRGQSSEDTVIRPTYSYLGSFRIAPKVISDICRYELSKLPEITRILKIQHVSDSNGYIDISVEISLTYPCDIPSTTEKIHSILRNAIEFSTSILAKNINVSVKSLSV